MEINYSIDFDIETEKDFYSLQNIISVIFEELQVRKFKIVGNPIHQINCLIYSGSSLTKMILLYENTIDSMTRKAQGLATELLNDMYGNSNIGDYENEY